MKNYILFKIAINLLFVPLMITMNIKLLEDTTIFSPDFIVVQVTFFIVLFIYNIIMRIVVEDLRL